MKFEVINELGNKITCKMLFCFKSNDISYVVYTNGHRTGGVLDVYASRYTLQNNSFILNNIESNYEWDLVDHHLANYLGEEA